MVKRKRKRSLCENWDEVCRYCDQKFVFFEDYRQYREIPQEIQESLLGKGADATQVKYWARKEGQYRDGLWWLVTGYSDWYHNVENGMYCIEAGICGKLECWENAYKEALAKLVEEIYGQQNLDTNQ